MSYCVVFGCKNRKSKKNFEQVEAEKAANTKFSFHLFPQDADRRNKWLKAFNLNNYDPPKSAAVCSVHFHKENYKQTSSKQLLNDDAIPYLFKEEHQETNVIENMEMYETAYNTMADNTSMKDRSTSISPERIMKDCSTSISPERIFNSPTKTRMWRVHALEIQSLKKKLYVQNYTQKKMQTELKSLKAVLKDLQKRNSYEVAISK